MPSHLPVQGQPRVSPHDASSSSGPRGTATVTLDFTYLTRCADGGTCGCTGGWAGAPDSLGVLSAQGTRPFPSTKGQSGKASHKTAGLKSLPSGRSPGSHRWCPHTPQGKLHGSYGVRQVKFLWSCSNQKARPVSLPGNPGWVGACRPRAAPWFCPHVWEARGHHTETKPRIKAPVRERHGPPPLGQGPQSHGHVPTQARRDGGCLHAVRNEKLMLL